jgi:uncharacterized membrane protein
LFRAAGALGVRAFLTWRDSGRWALAVMLIFAASAHFTAMRHDLAKMVPAAIPQPLAIIYITGVLEIAGAVGLLFPRTRRLAAICLILFFIAVFPANVKAARENVSIGGNPATALWLRLPMQALFIWLAWWSAGSREASRQQLRRGM